MPLGASLESFYSYRYIGEISRLEVEGSAAQKMASMQQNRANDAAADAERANTRAGAAMNDAQEARDRKSQKFTGSN